MGIKNINILCIAGASKIHVIKRGKKWLFGIGVEPKPTVTKDKKINQNKILYYCLKLYISNAAPREFLHPVMSGFLFVFMCAYR